MSSTITLTASARYGYGGKQYVARITGRHSKFTFNREFLGRKEGKRNESSKFVTDEPGLYETRDIDSKGRADDTYLVLRDRKNEGFSKRTCSKEEAMKLARFLEDGKSFEEAVQIMWPPKTVETPSEKVVELFDPCW